ncbi:unnamed protein product, partial [Ixodes persulcatus]
MTYTNQLRATMRNLRPIPQCTDNRTSVYVSNDLDSCSHIFLLKDGVKISFQQYSGPHKTPSRGAKTFTIDFHGRQETVPVDSLKPAHLEYLPNTNDTTATHTANARRTTDPCGFSQDEFLEQIRLKLIFFGTVSTDTN